ncbi:MAG: WD40 repeat domain-containing protein, partial [Acetobacteraceae bacterium]|nr:WD40 repeat domain-containing protein [Acetobacteraceae bacterium]
GDGTVRFVPLAANQDWRELPAHAGSVLAIAPGPQPAFITGGDDGKLRRIGLDGAVSDLAAFGSKWVEYVASYTGSSGLIACSAGKFVHLFSRAGEKLKQWEHPSTVTGLVFDPKGKRVAVSHYNGATLWFVVAKTDSPRRLEWKGSHTAIAIHPDGDVVVTAMQENALHGWRLSDGQHMRMTGYPAKTQSLSFSRNGKWLATSGADAIVLWPFFGGGPMGKAPTELAGGDGVQCTRVACHPSQDTCAAGFADGLIVLTDINSGRVLPVAAPGRGSVSALAWSPDGTHLALGTEEGFAAVVDFSKRG